jgi:hypothetical protein
MLMYLRGRGGDGVREAGRKEGMKVGRAVTGV